MNENLNRRGFLKTMGLGVAALTMSRHLFAREKSTEGEKIYLNLILRRILCTIKPALSNL